MNDITNIFNSPTPSVSSHSPAASPFKSPSYAKRATKLNQRRPMFIPHYNKYKQLDEGSTHSNDSVLSIPKKRQPAFKLNHKRSRLDMLDNSHLTSFPLAPPPASFQQPEKVTEILKSPEINAQEQSDSEILPDADDPIILVEDYIQTKQLRRKKLSVADLKTSLRTFDDNSIEIDATGSPSYLNRVKNILGSTSSTLREVSYASSSNTNSTLLTKCIVEEDESNFGSITTEFHSAMTTQSLFSSASSLNTISTGLAAPTIKLSDGMFDKPIAEFSLNKSKSSLKYCVICETPLYELSSRLSSSQNYSEFVCSGCTERYEMLSKLLDDFDQSIADLQPIPENIEDIEEALSQPALKRQKNSEDSFSITLINKLQNQLIGGNNNLQLNFNDKNSALWLLEAKRKLRWRWRISGLLPKFLTVNDNTNSNAN